MSLVRMNLDSFERTLFYAVRCLLRPVWEPIFIFRLFHFYLPLLRCLSRFERRKLSNGFSNPVCIAPTVFVAGNARSAARLPH